MAPQTPCTFNIVRTSLSPPGVSSNLVPKGLTKFGPISLAAGGSFTVRQLCPMILHLSSRRGASIRNRATDLDGALIYVLGLETGRAAIGALRQSATVGRLRFLSLSLTLGGVLNQRPPPVLTFDLDSCRLSGSPSLKSCERADAYLVLETKSQKTPREGGCPDGQGQRLPRQGHPQHQGLQA